MQYKNINDTNNSKRKLMLMIIIVKNNDVAGKGGQNFLSQLLCQTHSCLPISK